MYFLLWEFKTKRWPQQCSELRISGKLYWSVGVIILTLCVASGEEIWYGWWILTLHNGRHGTDGTRILSCMLMLYKSFSLFGDDVIFCKWLFAIFVLAIFGLPWLLPYKSSLWCLYLARETSHRQTADQKSDAFDTACQCHIRACEERPFQIVLSGVFTSLALLALQLWWKSGMRWMTSSLPLL